MSALNFWRLSAWSLLAVIIALSVVPGPARPHSGLSGELEHSLAYAANAAAFAWGYRGNGARVRLLLLLCALSAVLELVQIAVPGRTSEFAGFLASAIGASSGMVAGALIDCLVRFRQRHRTT